MHLVQFAHQAAVHTGVVRGRQVDVVDWELRDLLVLAAAGALDSVGRTGESLELADVELLAPVVPEARVFCAGINYADHQAESADVFSADIPSRPIVFTKSHSALCGARADLRLPASVSGEFDYEVELGVVIGAPGRAVAAADAWGVVAGFTIVNDITARDLQVDHVQWSLGKNTDAATPVGPSVLTIDETGPDSVFDLELEVNGVRKQTGSTKDMIFGVPELVETISRAVALRPGDVIATGTPSGVGFKRQPPEFLTAGDQVVARIPGIGALENTVR